MSSPTTNNAGRLSNDVVQFYFVVRPLEASPLSFAGSSIIDLKTASQPDGRAKTDALSHLPSTLLYSKTFGRHSSDLYWVCGNSKKVSRTLFKTNVTASALHQDEEAHVPVHSSLQQYGVSIQSFDKNHLLYIKQSSAQSGGNTLRSITRPQHRTEDDSSSSESSSHSDTTGSCTQSTACMPVSNRCAAWSTTEMERSATYWMRLDDTLILSDLAELTLAAVVVEQKMADAASAQSSSAKERLLGPVESSKQMRSLCKLSLSDDVLRVKLARGTWSHVAREWKRKILVEAAEMRESQKRAGASALPPPPALLLSSEAARLHTATSVLLRQDPTMSIDGEGSSSPVGHNVPPQPQQVVVVDVEGDNGKHEPEVSVTPPRSATRKAAATPRSSSQRQQQQQQQAPSVCTSSTATSPESATRSTKRRRSRSASVASERREAVAPCGGPSVMHREDANERTSGTANATVSPVEEVPSTDHETAPVGASVEVSASILAAKSVLQQRHNDNPLTDEPIHVARSGDDVGGGGERRRRSSTIKEKNSLSASFISASDSQSVEHSFHAGSRLGRQTPRRRGVARPLSLNSSNVNDNTCAETFDRRLNEALLELEQNACAMDDSRPAHDGGAPTDDLLGADEDDCGPRSAVSGTAIATTTTTTTFATTSTATTTTKNGHDNAHAADLYVAATPTARADKDAVDSPASSLAKSSQRQTTGRTSRSGSSRKTPSRGRPSAKKATPSKKKILAKAKKTDVSSKKDSAREGRPPSVVDGRPGGHAGATQRKVFVSAGDAVVRQQHGFTKTQAGLKSNFGLMSQYASRQPYHNHNHNADSQEVFFEH